MVPFTTPRASVVAESMHSQPFDPVVLIDTDPVTANVRTSTTTADRGIASARSSTILLQRHSLPFGRLEPEPLVIFEVILLANEFIYFLYYNFDE